MRTVTTLGAVLGLFLVVGAVPASAGQAVGADQAFAASVNGAFDAATIQVMCPGPAATGHPVPDQTLDLYSPPPPIPYGAIHTGYTGTAATRIRAVIPGHPRIVLATFTSYFAPVSIPTSIMVPCGGSSRVRFIPRPASDTSRAAWVSVSFASATVSPY